MLRQAPSKVDPRTSHRQKEKAHQSRKEANSRNRVSSETEHSKSAAGHAKGLVLYSSVGKKQGNGISRMCFRDDSDALLRYKGWRGRETDKQ